MNKEKTDNVQYTEAFEKILSDFPDRSRQIVAKRFGIGADKPSTLQAIGDEYGITRERVRQIVQASLRNVPKKNDNDHVYVKEIIVTHIAQEYYGIARMEDVITVLGRDNPHEQGAIRFFIEGIDEVFLVNPKKYPVHEEVIALVDFDVDQWVSVHDTVKSILEEKQKVYTVKRLHEKVRDKHNIDNHKQLEKYLYVSRAIGKNPFDKWGLYEWDEISPRGVREKALLIMKEEGKPMHFREIAKAIDEYGLGKKGRSSHPQTVHNELIRDNNFVLVGRGVYALNTDNYIEGTVKDVIKNILQKAQEPLTAQEIIDHVLEMRYVKPSTVRVNLNAVAKKMNGKYTLDINAR